MRAGTAEVLAWNLGEAYPVADAVGKWTGSPTHNAILSDRQFGRIGCAERIVGATHWFACVVAAGPLPAQAAAPPVDLPDTAMPGPAVGGCVRGEHRQPAKAVSLTTLPMPNWTVSSTGSGAAVMA